MPDAVRPLGVGPNTVSTRLVYVCWDCGWTSHLVVGVATVKPFAAIAIMLVMFALATGTQSQQCYSPVVSWQGAYKLTTNASGVGESGWSATVKSSAAGNLDLAGVQVSCPAKQLRWEGPLTAKAEVEASAEDSGPCPSTQTYKAKGSSPIAPLRVQHFLQMFRSPRLCWVWPLK